MVQLSFRRAAQACFALLAEVAGAAVAAPREPEPLRPRLLVVLVIDQMRADYLDRFGPILEGGLNRFRREGAWFLDARHRHAVTSTGPGHATISSGCDPARHGVVSNVFRGERGFKKAGEDPDEQDLAGGANGASSRELLVDGLGDWLKQKDPAALVAAISFKNRSAAMLGGRDPDVVLYQAAKGGGFTTSTFYAAALPAFVARFNEDHAPASAVGTLWQPVLSERDFAAVGCTADDAAYEGRDGLGSLADASFPHEIRRADEVVFTPLGDEWTIDLAVAAIGAMQLGADDATDLLAVSLSAADYVGHAYGFESRELADHYARIDRALPRLLDAAERAASANGGSGALFVLTADHGVAPIVEQRIAAGLDAGRIRPSTVLDAIETALRSRFGGTERFTLASHPDVYLSPQRLAEFPGREAEMRAVAAEAARSVHGIADAFPREELLRRAASIPEPFLRSFHPDRSGDVALQFLPYYQPDYLDIAAYVKANHATQYDWDQRVPVVFLGAGVRPMRSGEPFATVDIAPTLAEAAGAAPTAAIDGRAHPLPLLEREGSR